MTWIVEAKVVGDEELYDVFLGHDEHDKKEDPYRIFDYRPQVARQFFSDRECERNNIGTISLPNGKKSLRDLVEGDIITAHIAGSNTEFEYMRRKG